MRELKYCIIIALSAVLLLAGCGTKKEPTFKKDDQSYYYDIGVLQFKEGRYGDAAISFTESLKHLKGFDQSNSVSPRRVAEIYNYLGLSFLGINKYDDSINAFERALEEDASYSMAYNGLGNAYVAKGDSESAMEQFKKALWSNNPGSVSLANYNIGLLYMNKGKNESAYYSFKKALDQNPRLYLAYMKLGILLEKQLKYEEALETYRKGLEVFPSKVELLYSIGMIYFKEGDNEKAKEYFLKVLQQEPNSEFGEKSMSLLEMMEK